MTGVYLEWEDASSRSSWTPRDDAIRFAESNHFVRQLGFIIEETEHYVLFSSSWCPENEWREETFGDLTRIPKTWIRRRRVVMGAAEVKRVAKE